jgi:beta-lactamase superfamily II metal-dependent hydrolase
MASYLKCTIALLAFSIAAGAQTTKNLEIYVLDVEGGKAMLVVSPAGESMLVDAGWPAWRGGPSSTASVLTAVQAVGLKRIDQLVITHYDIDHLGDVPELASKIPIGHIFDHGDFSSKDARATERFQAYAALRDKIGHTVLKPGDTIPMRDVRIEVLTSGGLLTKRAGTANPLCARYQQAAEIPSDVEDNQSIGMLISYGLFRMLDLADLEAHHNYDLVCPVNRIGTTDVYNVNVHGQFKGIAPELVGAIGARVMIQANGAKKGADAQTWPILTSAPGAPDIWQLHLSLNAARDQNPPEPYIANMESQEDKHKFVQISVARDGSYRVTNARNGFTKQYRSAGAATGLSQHDFFYAGESKTERMFIVRNGEVAWSYTHPGRGEISDAALLPNGNVLFAHQYAITEITADKKVVWNYDAPPNTEIHTAMPLGKETVLFVQNGNEPKAVVVNKRTGAVEREFALPVKNPASVHGQFRRARLTKAGTLMVAHMDLGKVAEYDLSGKALWSVDAPGAWSAAELENGNVLIAGSGRKYVREVDRSGAAVWEFTAADAPELELSQFQTATRLANGNTVINNWFNEWSGEVDRANPPVQAFEVTRDKKVVWVLRSWTAPDLGPSTTIQVLR